MSSSGQPLVSVIVPSYNQGRYIGETIESILGQDYRPLEILVMDGASNDSTLEVLRRYSHHPELQVFSEPDKGVVDAVNKGFGRAAGSIWAIQSSDDLYLPGAIAAAVRVFKEFPQVSLVFGDVEHIDEHSNVHGRDLLPAFDMREYLGRMTYIPQPAAFFRADVAREAGMWNHEVSYVADADFWMRIALRHEVRKVDRMVAQYRYHAEQRDKHQDRILRDWERMVELLSTRPDMLPAYARAARTGVHLARYRYTPASHWWRRTVHLYRAALNQPSLLRDVRFPTRELLPGRMPIWAFLSKVKRRLRRNRAGA